MTTIRKYPFIIMFPVVLVLPFPLLVDSFALAFACINLILISYREGLIPQWKLMIREPLVWIGVFVIFVDPLTSLLRLDLQTEFRSNRLAFLLIPVTFYLFRINWYRISKCIYASLVIGVVMYILYSYFYLIYFYSFIINRGFTLNHYLKYDLTQHLPGAYHHTYIGLYMTTAILFLSFGGLVKNKWKSLLVSLFILSNQFFMGGKITLIISLLIIVIYIWKISRFRSLVLGLFAAASAIAIFFLNFGGLYKSLNFSISNRLLSWSCSLQAIQQNPWLGLGKYKTYTYLSECIGNEAVSSHNQFFNEFVNYGIFGVWLLAFFWVLYKNSSGKPVFMGWLGVLLFLCFFENVLSLQRGIFFVTFFAIIFILSDKSSPNFQIKVKK